ncbi:hypothetical protein SAMN04489759_101154 [Sulfitobacter delicatus]|uniref:Uncharacterized protein n=1 Tax=Sulfitobacter delicatus TaxID=218672 RepID=A0A1G7HKU9_9RHOB|nr:hypothetical protein SAMN04489759_101154 [Sulfitobacter delicatus]
MPVVPTGETFLKVGEWLERTPPSHRFIETTAGARTIALQ